MPSICIRKYHCCFFDKSFLVCYFCDSSLLKTISYHLFLIIYTRSYCIFARVYLFTLLLVYMPFISSVSVSILSFLNALQLFAQTSHSILHFQARWSNDSVKRYCWQLWPKLKLVKYHPTAPETGKQRKRTEKPRSWEGERERQVALYEAIYPFFRFFAGGLPRFRETIIRLR